MEKLIFLSTNEQTALLIPISSIEKVERKKDAETTTVRLKGKQKTLEVVQIPKDIFEQLNDSGADAMADTFQMIAQMMAGGISGLEQPSPNFLVIPFGDITQFSQACMNNGIDVIESVQAADGMEVYFKDEKTAGAAYLIYTQMVNGGGQPPAADNPPAPKDKQTPPKRPRTPKPPKS